LEKKAAHIDINASTEEKIKEAARKVFSQKGYAATRTRDIAEESGYNLALINYYFRSKEKLFDIIVVEHIQLFMNSISALLEDPQTTLFQKVELLVSHYIDMLMANPHLPAFVIAEIHTNPKRLLEKMSATRSNTESKIVHQWKQFAAERKGNVPNPFDMILNIIGLTVFPFIASPLFRARAGIDQQHFNELMIERKKLIPVWIKAIINTHDQ